MIFSLFIYFVAGNLYGAEYVAFSLKVAQETIIKAKGQVLPEVLNLGGLQR